MDMVTGGVQLQMLLYAGGVGFWLGACYCLFQMFRIIVRCGVWSCFFQDILFCLSAALATFFVFLAISDGCIYPYLLIGEGIGFLVFYCSVGKWLQWICRKSVRRWRILHGKIQKRLQPLVTVVHTKVDSVQTRMVTRKRRKTNPSRLAADSTQTARAGSDVLQQAKKGKSTEKSNFFHKKHLKNTHGL